MGFPSIDGSKPSNPSIGQYGLNTQGTDAGKVGEDGTNASKAGFPLNGPSLVFTQAPNDPTKPTNASSPTGGVKGYIEAFRESQKKLANAVQEFMNKYGLTEDQLYKYLEEYSASWKVGNTGPENTNGDKDTEKTTGDKDTEKTTGDKDTEKTSGDKDTEKTSGDKDTEKTSGDEDSGTPVLTPTTHQKVMFDAFALLALMLETSQKQRNAAREIRQSQNQNIQQAIVDQADMQRYAAILGLVFGAISCVISVAQFTHNSIQTGRGIKMENNQRSEFGIDAASTEFRTAQTAAKPVIKAEKDLANATEALNNVGGLTLEHKQQIDAKINDPNVTEQQFNQFVEELPINANDRHIVTEYKAAVIERNNQMANGGQAKLQRYNAAKEDFNAQTEAMKNTDTYKTAISLQDLSGMRSMAYSMVSRLMDSAGQGAAGIKNAEATEEGAAIKGAEEQLEQIKDIFKQYDDIIQTILSTRKSIVQAETEAIRSIFA